MLMKTREKNLKSKSLSFDSFVDKPIRPRIIISKFVFS